MAQQARANEAQFLEHLILRAEAIYNFQPPVLPPPRPWWKLWSKEERENVLLHRFGSRFDESRIEGYEGSL